MTPQAHEPGALNGAERSRYARHLALAEIGEAGQTRLKRSSVLLVGTGGLGSPAALYLAAAGVGHLGLVDFDTVDLSNLQRQVLFGTAQIGQSKAEAARERLLQLNPTVQITVHNTRLTAANAMELIGRYDIVADGSDNFATRFLLNDACFFARKILVSAAIFSMTFSDHSLTPSKPTLCKVN
jgi:adenylyltransferase/sulfurtransferase